MIAKAKKSAASILKGRKLPNEERDPMVIGDIDMSHSKTSPLRRMAVVITLIIGSGVFARLVPLSTAELNPTIALGGIVHIALFAVAGIMLFIPVKYQ